MENSKPIIFVLLLSLIFVPSAFAYDDKTTHPQLTEEAIQLFNQNYSDLEIAGEDLEKIKKGSTEEDSGSRPTKHFYDPIYNRGIAGFETSKLWSNDVQGQGGLLVGNNLLAGSVQSYFSSDSDYTFDRAVYDYVHTNKDRGLEALGHVIHLVQDASVPDHTRNDNHLIYAKTLSFGIFDETSPYEVFTTDPVGVEQIADNLIKVGQKPIIYSNLEDYFDNLARYSNGNFFSRDTILEKDYQEPKISKIIIQINKNGEKFTLGYDKNNLPLTQVTSYIDRNGKKVDQYSLLDDDRLVFSSYWSLLSKQAVLNSAGVIKLFFDRVEEEKRTHALLDKNKSFLAKVWDGSLALVGLSEKDGSTPIPADPIVVRNDEPVPEPADDQKDIDEMSQTVAALQRQMKALGDFPPANGACSVPGR